MGFKNVEEYVNASIQAGQFQYASFRKSPTIVTNTSWIDLSMIPSSPITNYYASTPLESAKLPSHEGIYHGGNVSPKTKHVQKIAMHMTGTLLNRTAFLLCDYLMYYPFIDMDSTDEQFFENTLSLDRYQDGAGVQAFIVSQGNYVGNASFTITYTNQDGVSGRVSRTHISNSQGSNATLITSGPGGTNRLGPFISLQSGDTGIRSVESITFGATNGGIAALVLCKPLAYIHTRDADAAIERDFFLDIPSLPQVKDGAYLNFLVLPRTAVSGSVITGLCEFIWG